MLLQLFDAVLPEGGFPWEPLELEQSSGLFTKENLPWMILIAILIIFIISTVLIARKVKRKKCTPAESTSLPSERESEE